MPWEEIGLCGGDGKAYEPEWGTVTRKMGLLYARFICGEPPDGCRLALKWFNIQGARQHAVALFWDPRSIKKAPRRYIWRCQQAIAIFDESVPWGKLRKDRVQQKVNIAMPTKLIG